VKFTEELYESIKEKWDEMADVPFVAEMANGSLSTEKFKYYMLQDYAYLKEYIKILEMMYGMTDNAEFKSFFDQLIQAIRDEIDNVHIQNMRDLGITEDEIKNVKRAKAAVDYNEYVKGNLLRGGIAYGATSLLQCSWLYAYIGKKMTEEKKVDPASPYAGWFAVYAGAEYNAANQAWIDTVEAMTADLGRKEKDELVGIFAACLEYEKGFFDMAYNMRY
jgi:thiaminase/transcriptional activator TenA